VQLQQTATNSAFSSAGSLSPIQSPMAPPWSFRRPNNRNNTRAEASYSPASQINLVKTQKPPLSAPRQPGLEQWDGAIKTTSNGQTIMYPILPSPNYTQRIIISLKQYQRFDIKTTESSKPFPNHLTEQPQLTHHSIILQVQYQHPKHPQPNPIMIKHNMFRISHPPFSTFIKVKVYFSHLYHHTPDDKAKVRHIVLRKASRWLNCDIMNEITS